MNEVNIPKHTVIQYLRNKKRIPFGVLVAIKNSEGFTFGYSVCNKKDRFCKKLALNIAIGRANTKSNEENVPHEVRKSTDNFFQRCKKYYRVGE